MFIYFIYRLQRLENEIVTVNFAQDERHRDHIRYTSNQYSKFKATDDSAVIFKVQDKLQFGLIVSVFADEDNDVVFEV